MTEIEPCDYTRSRARYTKVKSRFRFRFNTELVQTILAFSQPASIVVSF